MSNDPTDLTRYPFPSGAFVPADRNAEDLDRVVNGDVGTVVETRTGKRLASVEHSLINRIGFGTPVLYSALVGQTITNRQSQTAIINGIGSYYVGSLPYVVPATVDASLWRAYQGVRQDQVQPITHNTLAEAVADDNSNRQIVKLLERIGAEFRRAADQAEYDSYPVSAKFTDHANNLWVLNIGESTPIEWFGVTNSQSEDMASVLIEIQSLVKELTFNNGPYRTSVFRVANFRVSGNATINLFNNTTPVMVQFLTGAKVDGLTFNSTESNLALQRATMEGSVGAVITNCAFVGFRHSSAAPDAWGLYLKNTKNCIIEGCSFDQNSQADIAIVDECENISIVNCRGINDTFVVNIEPNQNLINRNMSVKDCDISLMYLLTNTRTEYPNTAITVISCTIDELRYDGADVSFVSCDIARVRRESDNNTVIYCGTISSSSTFGTTDNLIDDPYVSCLARDSSQYWGVRFSSNIQPENFYSLGATPVRHTRLNPTNTSGSITLETNNFIDVSAYDTLLFKVNARRLSASGGSNQLGAHHTLSVFNADDVLLETVDIRSSLYSSSVIDSDFKVDSCFIDLPVNAAKVRVNVHMSSTGTTNLEYDVAYIGIYGLLAKGSFPSTKPSVGSIVTKGIRVPQSISQYNLPMVDGDISIGGNTVYVVFDGDNVNGTSSQVVPLLHSFDTTVVTQS